MPTAFVVRERVPSFRKELLVSLLRPLDHEEGRPEAALFNGA